MSRDITVTFMVGFIVDKSKLYESGEPQTVYSCQHVNNPLPTYKYCPICGEPYKSKMIETKRPIQPVREALIKMGESNMIEDLTDEDRITRGAVYGDGDFLIFEFSQNEQDNSIIIAGYMIGQTLATEDEHVTGQIPQVLTEDEIRKKLIELQIPFDPDSFALHMLSEAR